MKTVDIKKGWLVRIQSQENDADYRSETTVNIGHDEKYHLDWLLAIVPRFKKSSWEKGPHGERNYYVGNIYEGSEGDEELLREIMKEAFEKHWHFHEYYQEFPDDFYPLEVLSEYGSAFLGQGDGQWTRDVVSVEVYEVPEDVSFKEVKFDKQD